MSGSPKLCATAARAERIAPFPRVPLAAATQGTASDLKRLRARVLTAERAADVLRGLADTYGALAWRAAA
jgi:hypothetical protein